MKGRIFLATALAVALSGCVDEEGSSYTVKSLGIAPANSPEPVAYAVAVFRGRSGDTCVYIDLHHGSVEPTMLHLTDSGPVEVLVGSEGSVNTEDGAECAAEVGSPTYLVTEDGKLTVDR